MVFRVLATLGVGLNLVLGCLGCLAALKQGRVDVAIVVALFYSASALAALGGCMVIGAGFERSVGQGLMCLFVPFYIFYFGFKNCQEGITLWIGGIIFAIIVRLSAQAMLGPPGPAVAQIRPNGDPSQSLRSRIRRPDEAPWTPPANDETANSAPAGPSTIPSPQPFSAATVRRQKASIADSTTISQPSMHRIESSIYLSWKCDR